MKKQEIISILNELAKANETVFAGTAWALQYSAIAHAYRYAIDLINQINETRPPPPIKTACRQIIAVDFDGTLFYCKYPEIGEPRREVINYIKAQRAAGNKIVLFTCRSGELLADALEACAEQGLIFDAVNENIAENIAHWGNDPRKISAHFYIDDRAIHPDDIINY